MEQDAYNNIVRTTVEAMAAVLGVLGLYIPTVSMCFGLPNLFLKPARNTSHSASEETGITNVIGFGWFILSKA